MTMTNRQALERTARARPDDVALYLAKDDQDVTYREFDRMSTAMGNSLYDLGIRKNDRVCLSLHNTADFPLALYGCFKIGAVPVALNYRLAPDDFRYVFDQVNAQAVVFDDSSADQVAHAADRSIGDPVMIGASPDVSVEHDVTGLVEAGSTETISELLIEPTDPAYIIYTSGTTGSPKGVVHSVENGRERVTTSIIESETRRDSVWLGMLPWFHGSGIDSVLNASFTMGATVVVERDYADPEQTLPVIESRGVTNVMSVPTITDRCAEHPDVGEYDLSSISIWRLTGEVLSEHRVRKFLDALTPNIYNSYGSSETGVNTMLPPEDLQEHAGSVGRPAVGNEIRVVKYDPDRTAAPSETVPLGGAGEVILKTDQLFREYVEAPEETQAKRRDGWYYTRDYGVLDEDGVLTITGRTDDMVLSGGELISIVGVEKVLESHSDVAAAIVVGEEDGEWGTRLKAYVSATDDLTETDLEAFCKEHDSLADYKRPRAYEFVDEIERTETGKKRRQPYQEDEE